MYIGSGVTPRGGQDVYTSEGVTFIRSQNVTSEGLILEDVAFIPSEIHFLMRRSEVHEHDVLFNITGASIGRCCSVPEGIGTANVNQHVCILRVPGSTAPDALFLATLLASPIGQRQMEALNTMGNRQGLNYQQLGAFLIPWPEPAERSRIAQSIDALESSLRMQQHEAVKLRMVKAGLMADFLTGRVRAPENLKIEALA
jgi:type I restriction enzyme S subunit